MAKFQDKHLKLKYNERSYFGDSDDCSIWHDGSEMRISCTISGVDPTQDYHLTTKWYVDDEIATLSGIIPEDFLDLNDTPSSYAGAAGYFITVTPGADGLEFTSLSGLGSQINHDWLLGLGDDDHPQYILADGSRDFSDVVNYDSHPAFTSDTDIVDKKYVDDEITTLSGLIPDEFLDLTDTPSSYAGAGSYFVTVTSGAAGLEFTSPSNISAIIDHGLLLGLGDDDHLQYAPTDGSRGFTATVSGIDPVADSDLATKWYVDQATDIHKETGRTALALNDSSKAVAFGTAFGDTSYSISVIMNNTTDANPSIYPMIVSNKTSSGFTVLFSGDIDSNNYFLEWIAVDDD